MPSKSLYIIALTGPPGCGKTTLVKNVCNVLRKNNFTPNGFITEEIREGRTRIGFDVVTLNGERAPLARVKSGNCSNPTVGKYAVNVSSFESSVLPVLSSKDDSSILVLDEVGKMEILSQKFKEEVSKKLNCHSGVILATIPLNTSNPIPLVLKIKNHPNTQIIHVDKDNRDSLINEITNLIINANKDSENKN